MNPLDAMWLHMESPDTPMHLGVLAVFSPPRSAAADFVQRLAAELLADRELASPWNQRLAGGVLSGAVPRLETVGSTDLDYHVRRTALPSPGGERELGVVLSRLHSNPLDHARPLWEYHLVEGLQGGRFAVYLKIHHALVEDITAVPALLATSPPAVADGPSRRGSKPWPAAPPHRFDCASCPCRLRCARLPEHSPVCCGAASRAVPNAPCCCRMGRPTPPSTGASGHNDALPPGRSGRNGWNASPSLPTAR